MLCTLTKEPFQSPEYIYEIKWDGYRIIGYKNGRILRLDSRSGLDYSSKYPPIMQALRSLQHNVVLDGEAVVLNDEGKPDFDALQLFNGGRYGVYYYVFDIIWLDGKNLKSLPLEERKAILRKVVGKSDIIRISDEFDEGLQLYQHVQRIGLEGIVAKKRGSEYVEDERGANWLKIPTMKRQEFVIGGWVESDRRSFRTLLFGAYSGKDLQWIGHAGGGFKESEMPQILSSLKELEIDNSPFANEVEYDGIVHWVKPKLVANIRYATMTKGGRIRKPAIFQGFRKDKNARQVVREVAKDAPKPTTRGNNAAAKRKLPAASNSNWPAVEKEKIEEQEEFDVGDFSITLYNVDRELWKGVNKADLIQYYNSVSKHMLPHLKDRPLTLHLKPKGPYSDGVYIKDMEGRQPACADIFTTQRKHKIRGKRGQIDYLVCNNLGTLLYMVNLGCVDINPWTSTVKHPEYPDFIVIDLDPSDGDFRKAIVGGQSVKEILDRFKLKAFPKTSGKTGLHIFVPCRGLGFQETRALAELLMREVNELLPGITTTAVSISQRGSKLYLDPNQNDYTDTVACVYSVRPFKTPNVSAPIKWDEMKAGLEPEQFTMRTIFKRLKRHGDLFAESLDINIAKANTVRLRKMLLI